MTPPLQVAELASRIDALLPQIQCRKCGFDGCAPYAAALAAGEAAINRCTPGGPAVIGQLSRLLGKPVSAVDASLPEHIPGRIAQIDEAVCIGCTLCIKACPVDAIIGAAKHMHSVLVDECSGCELCLPPCPVDCIAMVADPRPQDAGSEQQRADQYRLRVQQRAARQARRATDKRERLKATRPAVSARSPLVELAMQRARQMREGKDAGSRS